MPAFPKRKNPRLKEYNYSSPGTYFITICVRGRKPLLANVRGSTEQETVHHSLLPYGQIADRYIRQMDAFYDYLSVDRYMIMPDHIHMMISIHDGNGDLDSTKSERDSLLARFVGTFKRFCNKEYGENIWQDGFHDHIIRNQTDYDEVWHYIENNPLKYAWLHGDNL